MYHKTDAEQQFHLKMLRDIRNILNKYKIPSVLTNSALLGAYRDNDMIPWCMGAVLSTFQNKIRPHENKLIEEFNKAGFKISKHFKGENYKFKLKKGKFNIEIVAYIRGRKYYYRQLKNKKKIIPLEFLDPPYKKIELRGCKFVTTNNIEGLLTFLYGDWQTPRKSKSPSGYKTKKHMRVNK